MQLHPQSNLNFFFRLPFILKRCAGIEGAYLWYLLFVGDEKYPQKLPALNFKFLVKLLLIRMMILMMMNCFVV